MMRAIILLPTTLLALLATATVWADNKSDSQSQSLQSKITEIDGKNIDEWIKAVRDPDPVVRMNAVQTLMRFGKDAQKAGPALIERLSREADTSVMVNTLITMGAVGVEEKDIPKAVSELARITSTHTQSIVRLHGAVTLGQFGKDARAAIP